MQREREREHPDRPYVKYLEHIYSAFSRANQSEPNTKLAARSSEAGDVDSEIIKHAGRKYRVTKTDNPNPRYSGTNPFIIHALTAENCALAGSTRGENAKVEAEYVATRGSSRLTISGFCGRTSASRSTTSFEVGSIRRERDPLAGLAQKSPRFRGAYNRRARVQCDDRERERERQRDVVGVATSAHARLPGLARYSASVPRVRIAAAIRLELIGFN